MNFTVQWTESAEQDLADLWSAAPDRAAVTASANAIDVLLSRDPLNQGESRGGDVRILILPPLAVRYRVARSSRTVSIFAVWRWPA